jgi:hypothetical protein
VPDRPGERGRGGRVEEVVILEVDVPRSWLRQSQRRLWYCPQDVPADRIRRAVAFAQLAEDSPAA